MPSTPEPQFEFSPSDWLEPTHNLKGPPPFVLPSGIADPWPVIPLPAVPTKSPEIPGFEIVRHFAKGGMSNVYLGYQKGLNRPCVLKMIRSEDSLDELARGRFFREASAIASLRHPNIVQVYEIGEFEGMPYLCLEFVGGGDLKRRIRENLPTFRQSAEILVQLAEAMQAAHDREIIHRDLKPANVLLVDPEMKPNEPTVAEKERRIEVKLTDFGLAKMLRESSDLSRDGYAVGTPSYMPPEQAAGDWKACGKQSDVYGLGAILYNLLAGQPPFQGATPRETMRKIHLDAPAPPTRFRRHVPCELEAICLKCLEKKPADRYASARDLAADLRRFLQGLPVAARPIGPLKKGLRLCRRHPLRVVAILGILAVLIWAGLGIRWLIQTRTSDRPRDAAPAPVISDTALPEEIQQLLFRIRQDPTTPEHARQLADLGDEWLARLTSDFPSDFAVQYCAGEAFLGLDLPDRALSQFHLARRIAESRKERREGGMDTYANLADAYERIADIELLKNDLAAAARDYDQALVGIDNLHQDDPEERRWALHLAILCRKRADLYEADRQFQTAVQFYDRRIGLLAQQLPNSPGLAGEIRQSHDRLAQLHRRLGNPKAVEFHEREAKKTPK